MFGSQIRVEHLAGGQLRVVAPAYMSLYLPSLLFAFLILGFAFYRVVKMRSLFPLAVLGACSLPFFFISLYDMRNGSIELDRAKNTATLLQPAFFGHKTGVIPLREIQHAQLYFGRSSSRVVLVLEDGSAVGFSDATTQSGQGEAVQAINDYLGVR